MEKLHGKIDKIAERINSIDVTLAKQHEQLKEHIRRTNILEQKLEPVEEHVAMINGAFKFIGILSVIIGVITGIIKLL